MKIQKPKGAAAPFDTAKFDADVKRCRDSQMIAFENLGCAIYKKTCGLELSAPAEFWRFALGKTTMDECIKEIQKSFFDSKYNPTGDEWERIIKQILDIKNRRSPMTNEKWQKAKQDHKNDFTLIQRWVAEPNHPHFTQASLCFYTWEALAKVIHLLDWNKAVAMNRQQTGTMRSIEAERVKKQCERLGLIQAKLRLIKDVNVRPDGLREFVPFKQFFKADSV